MRIESPIPLIGALQAEKLADVAPDLVIEYDDCLPDIASERNDGPYQWYGHTLCFTHTTCARYLISANRIGVCPFAGADELEVAQMLVATAIPAALWCRGQVVFHAACAALPGRQGAVALAGPSGVGKSTLLHQLFERGARIVGDDTCTLSFESDTIHSKGLPTCLALRSNLSEARSYLTVPWEQALSFAPLAALYLIDIVPEPVTESFQPLTSREKLEVLLQNRHRPRVPRILQCEGRSLPDIVYLSGRLPIYRWRRQRGNIPIRDDELDFLLNASF